MDHHGNAAAERKLHTLSKQSSVGAPRLMVACMICYSAAQQQVPNTAPLQWRRPSHGCQTAGIPQQRRRSWWRRSNHGC
ncbi:hypothetical protein PF008_g26621 [Phytophthora fragariae]|uniref:Uncharacterized protein n=1 Tax=Phytophthora fragariae TaxID=53985 RepID=A0A6G0QGI8_9STRA|nr:hypothetical protein PF008_g26621 [Phytophthora fragariae]